MPTLVTVGNLVARKRHQDVITALALLRERQPELRYVIVGDGPERERLRALAAHHRLQDRVQLRGSVDHELALLAASEASLFVLPSVDEAFGVAYVEAMAHGVPAVGAAGEDGPEEIAAAGGGIELVPRGTRRRWRTGSMRCCATRKDWLGCGRAPGTTWCSRSPGSAAAPTRCGRTRTFWLARGGPPSDG